MKPKTKDELEAELQMYKALYFTEKRKLKFLVDNLQKYDYLLPDDYKSIVNEILKLERIKYHG